jgi:hypothetical protein
MSKAYYWQIAWRAKTAGSSTAEGRKRKPGETRGRKKEKINKASDPPKEHVDLYDIAGDHDL